MLLEDFCMGSITRLAFKTNECKDKEKTVFKGVYMAFDYSKCSDFTSKRDHTV